MISEKRVFAYVFFGSPLVFLAASAVNGYLNWFTIVFSIVNILINTLLLSDHFALERKYTDKKGKDFITPAGIPENRFHGIYQRIAIVTFLFLLLGPLWVSVATDSDQEVRESYLTTVGIAVLVSSWLVEMVGEGIWILTKKWWNSRPIKAVREDMTA